MSKLLKKTLLSAWIAIVFGLTLVGTFIFAKTISEVTTQIISNGDIISANWFQKVNDFVSTPVKRTFSPKASVSEFKYVNDMRAYTVDKEVSCPSWYKVINCWWKKEGWSPSRYNNSTSNPILRWWEFAQSNGGNSWHEWLARENDQWNWCGGTLTMSSYNFQAQQSFYVGWQLVALCMKEN